MNDEIIYMIGDETNRWKLENGVVFIYRTPTTREIVNYENSIRVRRHGKNITAEASAQQIALADAITVDVEGVGYRDASGKKKRLGPKAGAEDIAHFRLDGQPPATWKDLIPAHFKTQFIRGLLAGLEEQDRD
jgi:hypothetical protein